VICEGKDLGSGQTPILRAGMHIVDSGAVRFSRAIVLAPRLLQMPEPFDALWFALPVKSGATDRRLFNRSLRIRTTCTQRGNQSVSWFHWQFRLSGHQLFAANQHSVGRCAPEGFSSSIRDHTWPCEKAEPPIIPVRYYRGQLRVGLSPRRHVQMPAA